MAFEKAFDGMMVGLIPTFPGHDADDLVSMDRGIKLFYIEHIGGHSLGIDMALPPRLPCPLIDEAQHALHDEAAGLVSHHSALHTCLATAFRNRFRKEADRPNDFVSVLDVINEWELILGQVLRSRHAALPSEARAVPRPPLDVLGRRGTPLCLN